jgi:CCR4-NOT transcription complex subunit 1
VDDSNDMDVYAKYLRKLISGNAPTIFPNVSRPVENAANYPLLQMEMRKLAREDDQAQKIAESLDGGDGDLFRDFDLSTFMDHFKLDALEKTILALALKEYSKPELKSKGMIITHLLVDRC